MKTIVFIGDSVTRSTPVQLFWRPEGYVRQIKKALNPRVQIINSGRDGDCLVDLIPRWEADVLNHDPDLVSIDIGVNDALQGFGKGLQLFETNFEANYRGIIERTLDLGDKTIVLCEPFIIPLESKMKLWREDLQEKIFVIRNLAVEYGLTLIDFDRHLNEISQNIDPRRITKDGIHPTNLGSQIMAQLWSRIIDDKYVFDNQK